MSPVKQGLTTSTVEPDRVRKQEGKRVDQSESFIAAQVTSVNKTAKRVPRLGLNAP